jgi:hypothetical protein
MRSAGIRSERQVIRPLFAAALCGLFLAACHQGGAAKTAAAGPGAGLDSEILAWRTAVETNHPACASKIQGKGCEMFQVTCKAMQEITPDEAAKGVTEQIVASMSFNGRNPDGSSGKPGSSFALFSKAGGQWTRAEAMPVNMTTCAPV